MQIPAAFRAASPGRAGRSTTGRGPLVVATWDQSHIDFLVVARRGEAMKAVRRGRVARSGESRPVAQLAEHLKSEGEKAQRLLVLLPRAELDLTAIEVPAENEDELPSLVQLEVDQSVGESDRAVVVDFVPAAGGSHEGKATADENAGMGTTRVIAYWMYAEDLERLRQEAEAAGFKLDSVSARQLGPLSLLRSARVLRGEATVVLSVYAGEIEFTFFQNRQILVLRSVRVSAQEIDAIAEQIQTEIRRTVSLTGFGSPGEPIHVCLLARGDVGAEGGELAREQLAEILSADMVGSQGPVRSDQVNDDPVLWGAASERLLGRLPIDMLDPKKTPVPPNPWVRRAGIAAVAVIALIVIGYVLIAEVRDLERMVADRQAELDEATQVTTKLEEKADEARFVRRWQADQVHWLDHLARLSEQLPDGQLANVRRLSASASENGGRIDISVQVRHPELVARIEDRLRQSGFDVSSGQISEQSAGGEYPWQFDSRIAFGPIDLEEREETQTFVSDPLVVAGVDPPVDPEMDGGPHTEGDAESEGVAESEGDTGTDSPRGNDDAPETQEAP